MGDKSGTEASPYGTGVSARHLAVTAVMWAALAVTRGRGADLMWPLARVPTDPLRVLDAAALGRYLGKFFLCRYQSLTS